MHLSITDQANLADRVTKVAVVDICAIVRLKSVLLMFLQFGARGSKEWALHCDPGCGCPFLDLDVV